jgi:hypothetical protein
LELFLDVDLALLDERKKVSAQPGDLRQREAVLGDVDGLAREMRRGGLSLGRSGVAVGALQALLELDGANGGVDLEWCVEARVVSPCQGGEELRRPRAAVATVGGKTIIDLERSADWESDDEMLGAHVFEVSVVLDPVEAVAVCDHVLAYENLV